VRRVPAILLLLAVTMALLPATVLADAPKPRVSLPDIENEVMCVECGTALNISQAPSADRERAFIRRRIAEGMTKDEIKAALVKEYGPNVLGTPPDRGFNIAVWLVPVLLAIVAASGVALAARRWRRAGGEDRGDAEEAEPGPALDPEDARRLERDMASYDL
jgi:cytochrome c-type biogenesis protein CcmH/NrfF